MSAPAAGDAGAAGSDAEWAARARSALAEHAKALAERFDAAVDVDRLVAERSRVVDRHVLEAWQACIPVDAPLALFAVGGYGRGELFPHSDIDLLVLSGEDLGATGDTRHEDALSRFFTRLWDAGLPVGHAVRSAAQCTEAAAQDITVMTAILESRPLAAGAADRRALQEAVAPTRAWPANAFFEAKRQELRERHARHGDTSDNLEPNLKDGPGGLRDVQTLHWMALRIIGTSDLESLVAVGQLGADEVASLERERKSLSRLRFGLHLLARKHEERLRFDYQKRLAERLGYTDSDGTLAVEKMMQGFYRSASLVQRISERLLQRFEEQIEGEAIPQPLDEAFELRRGYLAARDDAWPGAAEDVFALFATWAGHDAVRGLHSQTARALAEALPEFPDYASAGTAMHQAFMGLLRGPEPVATLTRMARLGVLGRWIPAFARVSGRMQFDLFHVYTVDQHTLAVLKNLAIFASGSHDERFTLASEVWPRLRKPELLLLAGLFHDIGKGRGGDHSELGAEDARVFCDTIGLSGAESGLVEWLVRRHLLMSTTAQKQDITDPGVIHRFATEVADRDRLDHLYLLTCADIAGTSPKLWNAWKDRLLADLYTATRLALRRGLEHPLAATERAAENREAARAMLAAFGTGDEEIEALFERMPEIGFQRGRPDHLAWQALSLRGIRSGDVRVRVRPVAAHASALEVFVHSPDRDGLFDAIVATLDRLGLAIQQARVHDGPDGTIFDSFEVLPSDPRHVPAEQEVEQRLESTLTGTIDDVRPPRRTQPSHLRHFRTAPQIDFDETRPRLTQISLVCTDRPGLLAEVTRTFRSQALRVHEARIATFGARAEDLFQVSRVDAEGNDRPLDEPQRQALRQALLACIEGE